MSFLKCYRVDCGGIENKRIKKLEDISSSGTWGIFRKVQTAIIREDVIDNMAYVPYTGYRKKVGSYSG